MLTSLTCELVNHLHLLFMLTPFRPDIVVHNTTTSSLLFFELTFPLDSAHHLAQARSRKRNKIDSILYQPVFDQLAETFEISVLGHFCHQRLQYTPFCW